MLPLTSKNVLDRPSSWTEYLLLLAVGFLQGCVFYASYRYSPAGVPFLTAVLLPVPFYLAGKRDRRFWTEMALWGALLVLIDLGLGWSRQLFDSHLMEFVLPFAALAGMILLLPSFLAKIEEGTFFPSWGTLCAIVLRVLFAAALAAAAVALFWVLYGLAPRPAPSSLIELWESVKNFPDAVERALRILNVGSWSVAAPVLYRASHRPWLPKAVTGKGAVLLPCLLFSVAAAIVWGAWLTAEEAAWKDPNRKREWVVRWPVYGEAFFKKEERLRCAAQISRSLSGGRSLKGSEAFFLLEDLDGDGKKDVLFYCEGGFHLLPEGEYHRTYRLIREAGGADEPAGYCAKAVAEGRYRTTPSPWKMLRFPELYKDVFPVPLVEGRASGSDRDARYREVLEARVREWLTSMPVFGGSLTEEERLSYLSPLVECFPPLTFDRSARTPFCLLGDFDGDGGKELLFYIGGKFFLMAEGKAFAAEWAFMDVPDIPFSTPGDFREEVAAGRYRLLPDTWKILEVGDRRFRVAPRDYDAIRRAKRSASAKE